MLFRLFDLQAVSRIRQTTDGGIEPRVFVFAGSMDKFEDDVFSQFPYQFSFMGPFIRICGFPIHEVRDYSIVLVGHQADIDRVLSDDFSLLQAHTAAYPATCPQCHGAVLPITVECGGPRWNGICNKCSSVYHVEMGILFVYDLKSRSFVPVEPEAAPGSAPPGLPSPADVSEPVSPDPEPKTWRQLPPLF